MNSICYTTVFGSTGSGKSTLLNILYGKKFSTSDDGDLIFQEGTIFKVSSETQSETKLYQEEKLKGSNMYLVDTPGCQDTDPIERIENLYKLKNYFKQQYERQFKFIFLFTDGEIKANRGQGLRLLMKELFQLFKNFEDFTNSTLVVFSRVRPYEVHSKGHQNQIQRLRRDFLKDLIENRQGEILNNSYNFFNQIPQENFFTFSEPQDQNDCQIVEKEREKILDLLKNKIQSVNKVLLNTQHKLDSYVKIFIQEKFDKIRELMQINRTDQLILQNLITTIVENAEITQKQKQTLLEEKKQQLQILENYIKQLKLIQFNSYIIDNLQSLYSIVNKYNDIEEDNHYKKNLNSFSTQFINTIIQKPSIDFNKETQTLTLKAFYLHSSYMDQEILPQYRGNNLKKIIIKIEHAFIFDSNEFSFRGGQLALKCKKFIIAKQAKMLDLSGKRYEYIKSKFKYRPNTSGKGEDGQDGLPGDPGENGGCFLLCIENQEGIISKYKNTIQVDVSGGKGYDGQDGGNGGDGRAGKDGDFYGVEQRKEYYLAYVIDITEGFKKYFSFNNEYALYYKSNGEPGQKGGNGGKGGSGGQQGNHGDFDIISWNGQQIYNSFFKVIKDNRPKGKDGKCGFPGRGGEGGQNFIAVYKDEFFCPTIRGITSEMNKKQTDETNFSFASSMIGSTTAQASITTLAKLASLPVGIAVSSVQGLASIISASTGNGFIDGPRSDGRANKGEDGNRNFNLNKRFIYHDQNENIIEYIQNLNNLEKQKFLNKFEFNFI
ncbi:50S ribosome-binding GTPase (macronuclear) [Tetrahymena thermophila SB210]|uniref:50S ribosome-binding GTPase n=1 Tax=Tetrahymena thermophila (strain SB210) TaxID=312017 RepID=Q23FS2_TETTS|nr:50S ribosome-binding GTPase [Tetrahymena thermophila SB210]EAR95538.2 50S ribosome-binding GTPase [Tetrahymena thermophila SB210]|eukprot:XP_001015783.2 50S ribosome-binding GTPase [Tetrahymena thermophila SB210]